MKDSDKQIGFFEYIRYFNELYWETYGPFSFTYWRALLKEIRRYLKYLKECKKIPKS